MTNPTTSLYLPARDKQVIAHAAAHAGESVSEFIRKAALARAGAPSLDREVEDLKRRLAALEHPAEGA